MMMERARAKRRSSYLCFWLTTTAWSARIETSKSTRALEDHEAQHRCGQKVAKVTKKELFNLAQKGAENLDPVSAAFVSAFVLPFINFGLQTMKICASCEDFEAQSFNPAAGGRVDNSFADYCGPEAYGFNATVSGLVIMPYTNSSNDMMGIPPGPMKGAVWMHGSQSQTFRNIPSEYKWDQGDVLTAIFPAFPTVIAGTTTILPDYLGYGESAHKFYKSYLIRRAYQTSTMPLWLKAKELVRTGTNCTSELVDVVTVNGYSEGGYSALAVSAAMINSGVQVLGAYAGAGPYRMSSSLLFEGVSLLDGGLYPKSGQYYLALWGSSYSSTNTDLPNYGKGQNFLADAHREEVINWVQDGYSSSQINDLIPDDEPLSLGNQDLVGFLRMAVARNNTNPCSGYDASFVGVIDKICEAFIENDLTNHLEEEAQYPINLCHSVKDDKVVYSNVGDLNLALNPFLSHEAVVGDHNEAFFRCFVVYNMFLQSDIYRAAPTQLSEMCASAPDETENAPSMVPVEAIDAPVEEPTAFPVIALGNETKEEEPEKNTGTRSSAVRTQRGISVLGCFACAASMISVGYLL